MMPFIIYAVIIIPINIGVLAYIREERNEQLLVMMIPLLLEVVRYVFVKIGSKYQISSVILGLVAEVSKFILMAIALFAFVSPMDSENMYTSIVFCVNFFVAQYVGIYVVSRSL